MNNTIIPNLVSTIIPVRNRPQFLRESVESVLHQTYRPIEVIIVDDGSTDDTPAIAREYVKRYSDEVVFVPCKHFGRGPGPVREAGRQVARGEFLQYLDSDDLLWPCKFAVQVASLRERPECGVSYGWTRFCGVGKTPETQPYKWTGKEFEFLFPALLVDRWWSTNTPLYRRSITDAVGSWTDIRWGQDWAYDARVAALGTRLAYCPQFICDWREHHGVRQTAAADQYTYERLGEYHRLQQVIFESAVAAHVPFDIPEMRHFSRVEFMIARGLGVLGAAREAQICFELARQAAGPVGANSWEFQTFSCLIRLLGWKLTGKLAQLRDRLYPGVKGHHSMNWSWAQK